MSEPLPTLVASLAYRLGGATQLARFAGLEHLSDALAGLQGVLYDSHLHMRASDGRALLRALEGFEAIFVDLQVGDDDAGLRELRGALAAARGAAQQIADLLERPPLFEAKP